MIEFFFSKILGRVSTPGYGKNIDCSFGVFS